MKKLAVFLLTGLTCASMLFGCGSKNDTVETVPVAEVQESTAAPAETESETETETVEEDVPPEEGMVKSDLTGEWISGDLADQRPIAVMIPDENAALPHYGLSNADILYECSVEGNMTRLMAVFKDWKNIERIGNIRSCRDYYVYWAKEWDAIYCHIGGPFYILNAINDPTTNNITGAVLASDPSQKKGLYDADLVINSGRGDPVEAVLRATHGRGVDLAVEASGSPAGIAAGIKALRPGGRMAVLGATKQPSVPIPWDAALRKAVTLQFNMMSDYTHMDRALALLAAFPGDLSPLITHRHPLAEWEQCFTELRDQQGIKGLITIG